MIDIAAVRHALAELAHSARDHRLPSLRNEVPKYAMGSPEAPRICASRLGSEREAVPGLHLALSAHPLRLLPSPVLAGIHCRSDAGNDS